MDEKRASSGNMSGCDINQRKNETLLPIPIGDKEVSPSLLQRRTSLTNTVRRLTMPLFKKSPSDTGVLSERFHKALQKCRMLLLKDADVTELLEVLQQDEFFKSSDVRDSILSQPTRQQRVAALLDRVESRGDRTFFLLMDALKEHYKQLHSVMEETLRNVDDMGDIGRRDRLSIAGDNIRKLLKSSTKRKLNHSQESDSIDDLDAVSEDAEPYIECYSIPLKGRLCKESWIKHVTTPRVDEGECSGSQDNTYMAVLSKQTVFKKTDIYTVPNGIKLPPKQCVLYTMDSDQTFMFPYSRHKSQNTQSKDQDQSLEGHMQESTTDLKDDDDSLPPPTPLAPDPPPPVPPKPDHLPSLGFRPPSVRTKGSSEHNKDLPSNKTPNERPKTLPKPKHFSVPVVKVETRNESEDDDLDCLTTPDCTPPVPPKFIHSYKDDTANDSPDSEHSNSLPRSPQRPLSDVIEEPIENGDLSSIPNGDKSQPKTPEECFPNKPLPPIPNGETEDDSGSGTDEEDKNGDEEADASYESDYEPIRTEEEINASKTLNCDNNSDQVRTESETNRDSGTSLGSMEKTHVMNGHCNRDNASADSIDAAGSVTPGSVEGNMATDSGIDTPASPLALSMAIEVPHPNTLKRDTEKQDRAPLLKPRGSQGEVQVLPPDVESDSDDSYYEDIDMLNNRSPSGRSLSCVSYLDPKSYARALDQAILLHTTDRDNKQMSDTTDRVLVLQGELFIAEVDTVINNCEKQNNEEEENEDSQYWNTVTLCYDKLGRAFYIPADLLRKHGDPEGESWFYPIEISSRQAAFFLSEEKQEGCFIVYTPLVKCKNVVYNLSVCRSTGDVVHYHIVENAHGDVMIENHDHSFMNVRDLVTYFKRNKSGLVCRLRRALKEAKKVVSPGCHYDIKWEVNRKALTLTGQIMGRGQFGVVCAGLYHKLPVAVKVLQNSDAGAKDQDDFLEEAQNLMTLKHEHVVRLVGVSCTALPFFIVTEYISRGNLRDCLREGSIPTDNMDILFDLCIQLTAAMNYLEGLQFMLHRDLAARNCLIADDMCLKLGDFGRARFVTDDCYQAARSEKIAVKWSAPEVLGEFSYSTKSDVWSLGIVFWEIFSAGDRPYASLSAEQTAIYVTEGGRLEKPPYCSHDLYSLMKCCWKQEPKDRPTVAYLYDRLKSKSCLYYGPIRPRESTGSDSGSVALKNPSPAPVTPSSNLKTKPTTPKSKTRKTVYLDSRTEELAREAIKDAAEGNGIGNRGSGERLHTSSSETSLISSVSSAQNKDDLTRGDKIRKSLRKMIQGKQKRKSKSDPRDGEKTPTKTAPNVYHQS